MTREDAKSRSGSAPAHPTGAIGPAAGGNARRPWAMVVVLTVLAMLAMLDKNIVTLLIRPIKHDLALSDVQIGLMIGTAFAVANLLIGLPAGWMADRWHRKSIIAVGVLLWSAMTVLCGLSRDFGMMFMARAGVGLSEGLIPATAYALIHDGVDPLHRGRAFSIFAAATLLGTGAALAFGGIIIGIVGDLAMGRSGLLAGFPPWSITLILAGTIGAPLTLLLLTFPEPRRHRACDGDAVGFGTTYRHLWGHRAIYLPLALFSVMHAMMAQSNGVWLPTLAQRRFGLTPQEMGPVFGIVLMVTAPLGLALSGLVIDRLTRRGQPGAAWVALGSSALLLVAQPMLPLAPSQNQFWLRLTIAIFGASSYLTVTSNVVAQVAPRDAVGKTIAVFLVLQGLLGSGAAPAITGFATEHVFAHSPVPISMSMSVMHGLYSLVALAAAIVLLNNARRLTATASPTRLATVP